MPIDYDAILREAEEREAVAKAPRACPVSDSKLVERARAYIAKMPPAISGQGGHSQTLCVARVLVHDFALSEADAWALLNEYNAICQPPWSEKELRHKLSEALKLSHSGQCESAFAGLRDAGHVAENVQQQDVKLDDFISRMKAKMKPENIKNEPKSRQTCDSSTTKGTAAQSGHSTEPPIDTEPPFRFAGELIQAFPDLRPPVIYGLLREGETINLIAPPKLGKTWITLDMAFGIATGRPTLGFDVKQGRVLILDNELHGETVAHRLSTVALAKGIPQEQYADRIAYRLLRGKLRDLFTLEPILNAIQPNFFKLIILDAFYRFLPKDTDENDNGGMAALYNRIDAYAEQLRCAFVVVHHTSKGLQSGRAVTDVGAGAGAISRAADCHLILRPHKEKGAVVLDAMPRSWPPAPSTCIRFRYPLWLPAPDLDPAELLSARAPKQSKVPEHEVPPTPEWTRKRFVSEFVSAAAKPKPAILAAVEDRNDPALSCYKAEKFIETAEGAGEIYRWDNGPKKHPSFATVPQPEKCVNEREGESGFALEVNSKATTHTPSLKRRRTKKPNGDKVPA